MSTFELIFSGDKFVHLRDKILNFAIHTCDGSKPSPTNLQTCRLINKDCLHSVSICLQKSREPLFQIQLKNEVSSEETPDAQEDGKPLNQFLELLDQKSRLETQAPQIKVTISDDFFRKENLQKFASFLSRLGNSVVDLEIAFPSNGGSMTFIFPPNLSFKLLQKFTLLLRGTRGMRENEDTTTLGRNCNLTYFISAIFNGCESLAEFKIPFRAYENLIPFGFEQLNLPTSLTKLELMAPLEEIDLEILTKNSLPNLQKLMLFIPLRPLADGLIFEILERVRETLHELVFAGFAHDGNLEQTTKFWFPVMDKLKELVIGGVHIELESRLSPIAKCVPNLRNLRLLYHTPEMFRRWTENSTFKKVTNFGSSLVDEALAYNDESHAVNFDYKMVELIHKGFPNLTHLHLNICGDEITGVLYIFHYMRQLKALQIKQKKSDAIVDSDHWDAVLTGIPVEWMAPLKKTREHWSGFRFEDRDRPAITNMTQLKSLILLTGQSSAIDAPTESLISDVAFHFGFLRMPRLAVLVMTGRFKASEEMVQRWTAQNRFFSAEQI